MENTNEMEVIFDSRSANESFCKSRSCILYDVN